MTRAGELTTTGEARVYTMRELNQHTARVMDEINASGEQAMITKHGRFVALITPLRNASIESVVFREGPLAREIEDRISDDRARLTYSSGEVAEKIKYRYSGVD